jgi:CDP-6-deoxy-D-xylo-4-hexulose-3-dehydrase
MANNPFWNERYQPESFPNAELIDKYGFYIPNHQDLTKTEIETVTTIINENWD